MKKRFTEAQIVGFQREVGAGVPVKDLCRKHGFSEASYYLWRSKSGGMNISDAKRLKDDGRRCPSPTVSRSCGRRRATRSGQPTSCSTAPPRVAS